MGRRHIYFCDNCKKDFGNDIHVNIKSAQVFVSFPQKMDEKDPTKTEWGQRQAPVNQSSFNPQEHHFCNGKCLGEFTDKKIAGMIEKLHHTYLAGGGKDA